ncbi:hypothetical protein DL769_000912 [Monosporascus sp. CRB-8-3]|nr:hypothetical protein DL769_000912 [Monosporascus sp. CRB-8-3]
MRKSRSSHVKCDCGEKTHKCAHLQPTMDGHKGELTALAYGALSIKEPVLDTVAESESDQETQRGNKSNPISRRRRANTTHSEPMLSFDEHGHHKPVHKLTKASQKCGPYSLTRGASLHSTSSSSSLGSKSVDGIHHIKDSGRPRAALSRSASDHAESGQASPGLSFQQLNGQLPPLDLSSIQYPEYAPSFDMFPGLSDQDPPIFSAGLSAASVDWTQYDGLEMNGDSYAPSSFGQAQSYSGFDPAGSAEPTLTSNSGDVSETEDFMSAFSDSHMDGFRTGGASSFLNMSQNQAAMLVGCDLANLDYDEFKGTAAASKFLTTSTTSLDDSTSAFSLADDDALWSMSNFNDGITQSPDPVASCLWDL